MNICGQVCVETLFLILLSIYQGVGFWVIWKFCGSLFEEVESILLMAPSMLLRNSLLSPHHNSKGLGLIRCFEK